MPIVAVHGGRTGLEREGGWVEALPQRVQSSVRAALQCHAGREKQEATIKWPRSAGT